MFHDYIVAALGGIIGTGLMTGMMLFAKQVNLPAVDAHGILGFMLNAEKASPLGYIMHFVLGIIFALGYAFAFQVLPYNLIALGALLGILHWLVVGWMFGFAPLAHAGMKAGTVPETGAYMLKSLGFTGFIAGMIGHIVFGITVAIIYWLMGGTLA